MRKQTKLVAVLSAAALVALGASMTSMAAGWTQENGQWYYYNTNGDYVTDEWKRSGDNYFYLGWDGYMLTNQLVQHGDNYYYVDANGAMVKNQWIAVAADDSEYGDVDHRWYYFGSTGRAYRNSAGFAKKTINGQKYAFDDQGRMLYGWVDGDGTELNDDTNAPLYATYFLGPNDTTTINGVTYTGGAMVTGWYNYLDGIDEYADEGKDSLWFYFNPSTGVKVAENDNKRIGGLYYSFDEYGVMNSGWQIASGSNASESKYYSGADQGWRQRNTWVWAVPSEDQSQDDYDNDTYRWFYVGADGTITSDSARRINSKWYIFDEVGRMKSGLVILDTDRIGRDSQICADAEVPERDGNMNGLINTDYYEAKDIEALDIKSTQGLYYFSSDEEHDGAMKTGNNIRIELADGTYTFGFSRNGRAFDGVENNKLYNNGILQTGGDMRYDLAKDPNKTVWYVVGPTGTFASNNSTVKDADDNYYAVVDGHIFKVPADDAAAQLAKAIVNLGQGKATSMYVEDLTPNKDGDGYKYTDGMRKATAEDLEGLTVGDQLYVRVGSSDYIEVVGSWEDDIKESSYKTNSKSVLDDLGAY